CGKTYGVLAESADGDVFRRIQAIKLEQLFGNVVSSAAKRRNANRPPVQLFSLLDLGQSDQVIDRLRDIVEDAFDAPTANRCSDDPRIVSDIVHIAGEQSCDGWRSGDLNQFHVNSLGAKKAAFGSRE